MADTPVAPTDITTLPTAPARTMAPAVFVPTADAFVAALPTFGTQTNAAADNVFYNAGSAFDSATEAATSAGLADTSADAALATADFQGAWSGLTGAKTAGMSCSHLGMIWILLNNLANVALSEPGVTGDWTRYGGTYYTERTSNVILSAVDAGKAIKYTSGTFSQTLTAAASLGDGWAVILYNGGTGVITLDPNSTELIDGASTKTLVTGQICLVYCTGTAFKTISYQQVVGDHSVVLTTGNGFGSTNTKVRRFTTTQSSAGTALTYADSAANGMSVTVNETGLYAIYYLDSYNVAASSYFGVSVNSAQLTTNIESITAANRLAVGRADNGTPTPITVIVRLTAADVIRAHTDGQQDSVTALSSVFRICKIGV